MQAVMWRCGDTLKGTDRVLGMSEGHTGVN